jgi:pyridoxamine 5'-phosphate oxidase
MAKLATLIEKINDAVARAKAAGTDLPNGMCLATVDADGRPSARTVLLKGADERGFVFYTNYGSRKARELQDNPRACLLFWWGALQEQVRIEGTVERVSEEESDAYFATRPRGSQLGAWASRQSEPLSSRAHLLKEVGKLALRYMGREVPRPEFWGGYRLVPERIEFWYGHDDRLHTRREYERTEDGWTERLLFP